MRHEMSFTAQELQQFEDISFNMSTEFNGAKFLNTEILEKILTHMWQVDTEGFTEKDITSFARMHLEYLDEFIHQEEVNKVFLKVLQLMRNLTPGY